MRLDQRADGVVTVHSAPGTPSSAQVLSPGADSFSDAGVVQVSESLLPFLFPSCDGPRLVLSGQ